jgi:5-methylthioadenosine/S-adenosylhomocysteine deaminase
MRTLVHGRSLLTGRTDVAEITGGGLIEEGGAITAVGPAAELRRRHGPEREIGGWDRVVVPGLVSAHQHGGGVTSVQLGCPDQPFERWMIRMTGVPPLDPYLDTLFHAARFIESGITTTIHSHYTRDPSSYEDEVESHLRAWAESGIRVAFAPCFLNNFQYVYETNEAFLSGLPTGLAREATRLLDIGPSIDVYLDLVAGLRARSEGSAFTRILLGPVAPQWCTIDALERMAADGDPSAGVHAHLLESPAQRRHLAGWPGASVVAWLDELGFLGPGASFAHGIWLGQAEIELLAARGAHLVHNPSSNLRVGNGIAHIPRLRQAGVPVALGTDDMTLSDDEDLLSEARLAGALANPRGFELGPADLLNMATERGAAAARFGEITGTLEVGHRADVVLLDVSRLEDPVVHPDLSMLDLVAARGRATDVRTVLIDGKVMFEEGVHTWIDRRALAAEVRAVFEHQIAQPEWRRTANAAEQLARAWDEFPMAQLDALPPLTDLPWVRSETQASAGRP